jgi:hypothetical protein
MHLDLAEDPFKQGPVTGRTTDVPPPIVIKQPFVDERLCWPIGSVEREQRPTRLKHRLYMPQRRGEIGVLDVMHDAIHHNNVCGAEIFGGRGVEEPCVESSAIAETGSGVIDTALVYIEANVLNSGGQVTNNEAWAAPDVDDSCPRGNLKISANSLYASAEESPQLLIELVDGRVFQDFLHAASILLIEASPS